MLVQQQEGTGGKGPKQRSTSRVKRRHQRMRHLTLTTFPAGFQTLPLPQHHPVYPRPLVSLDTLALLTSLLATGHISPDILEDSPSTRHLYPPFPLGPWYQGQDRPWPQPFPVPPGESSRAGWNTHLGILQLLYLHCWGSVNMAG